MKKRRTALILSITLPAILIPFSVVQLHPAQPQVSGSVEAQAVNSAEVRKAASQSTSVHLTTAERHRVADSFLRLVQIKGPSRHEQAVAAELRQLLTPLGAREIPPKSPDAPANLVMEIPATGNLSNQPTILLNAHIDTITESNPDRMAFSPTEGDFYHLDDGASGKSSSFGGDDRSGVTVIIESLRALHDQCWSKGIPHRRILIVFTAEEEIGLRGAKYLAAEQPELFADVDITLSVDGPLDLRSNYPTDSFVFVVAKTNEVIQPFQRLLKLADNYCKLANLSFGRTEIGLGLGDFAAFPTSAKADLHLRSPVRGWHAHERVKIQDLVNHTDLLYHLLLGWDDQLPSTPPINP